MKKTHIIGILIIAVAIAIIITSISDSGTYESFSTAINHPDKEFHVVGKLNKEKEISYNPKQDANLFSFFMVDEKGLEKKVVFNGAKPQDFERSEQIVIIGKASGEEFAASKILMKCPSKYTDGKEGELKEFTEVK
jgi:cytochrome c-type biogenesis protein CcmE